MLIVGKKNVNVMNQEKNRQMRRMSISLGLLALAAVGLACDEEPVEAGQSLAQSVLDTNDIDEEELSDAPLEGEGEGVELGEIPPWEGETPHDAELSSEGAEDLMMEISMQQRACEQNNDCRSPCSCISGGCMAVIGPLPPAGYCDEPPTRSCSSASDCRGGCSCTAGTCKNKLLPSPLPPELPRCHLPPPDEYEFDDTWPNFSGYSGPQRHNFDDASDRDWAAVHIVEPGTVRFQTKDLTHGTDTKLKIFAFDGASKGLLLGVHDDVGGWFFDPESQSSRVDLEVGPNSFFLIKVINKSDPNIYSDSHELPSYTLHLSYI